MKFFGVMGERERPFLIAGEEGTDVDNGVIERVRGVWATEEAVVEGETFLS